MQDDEFSWRDEKAESNAKNHGVTFEQARNAFNDAFAVQWQDDSQDDPEPRYSMIAMDESRLLFIAFTERDDRYHIISARRATHIERRK
jgi:uncharacterized DUF497 family protein